MMKGNFPVIDCNCMLGVGPENEGHSFDTVHDLKKFMETYCIKKVIVYGALAKHYHPDEGNEVLSNAIKGEKDIYASWVVLPGYTGEFPSGEELAGKLSSNHVVAARLCPKKYSFLLSPWACDDFMSILNDMHMPLLLDFDIAHWSEKLPWDDIRALCKSYKSVPFILNRVGCGYNRILFPLLSDCPNLHFEISYFDAFNGIEAVASRFGSERMLFGSDAPVHDPACPISMLYFAEISDIDKEKIASGNMEKLMEGITYA